ncbi:hypothetical protein C4D60_Mb09t01060 [Musa balbisiana]|uniref:WW domain-containing protein n=1 Tax=Musa balbisiana TaxID=52838 RepID=A0A4S8ID41_MUSBA|nr:hypothetical protein C4D60_Mb09t01060 [Musa balbisiana]
MIGWRDVGMHRFVSVCACGRIGTSTNVVVDDSIDRKIKFFCYYILLLIRRKKSSIAGRVWEARYNPFQVIALPQTSDASVATIDAFCHHLLILHIIYKCVFDRESFGGIYWEEDRVKTGIADYCLRGYFLPSQNIPKWLFLDASSPSQLSRTSVRTVLRAMTAPNIEMIAALLRSCNLGRGGGRVSPPSAAARRVEASDESAGQVTVELNSETALPYHWEQCLDMRTGEVYYINRETGTRTSKDPRTAVAAATYSSSYHSEEDVSSDDDSYDHEDSVDTANSCLTSLSSTSTSDTSAEPSGGHILVSAGCRSCFMYFMVPKSIDACPKCGGRLLKLGRDGCV